MKRIDANSALRQPETSLRMKLFLACLLAVSLSTVVSAQATFKCVDEKGVTHYGDTMPPQCAKKEVTEMSKSGSLIRKYDAPLTPEQLKAREEERLRQAEGQRRTAEQRQKDMALLSTFGSEREFDVSRDRDLLQLDARIKTLQQRIAEVDMQLAKLKVDIEFYSGAGTKDSKAGNAKGSKSAKTIEVPERLTQALSRANADRSGLDEEVSRVEHDKVMITARYDADKARWKKMKAGMQPGTLVDSVGNPSPAIAPAAVPEKRTVAR